MFDKTCIIHFKMVYKIIGSMCLSLYLINFTLFVKYILVSWYEERPERFGTDIPPPKVKQIKVKSIKRNMISLFVIGIVMIL